MKASNKPPIILASNKYYSSSNDQGFNMGYIQQQMPESPPSGASYSNNSNYGVINNSSTGQLISLPSTADQPIDSALLSAMANPRERMALFQIENNILKFLQSK